MKILFTYDYGTRVFAKLEEQGYSVSFVPEREIGTYEQCEEVDILICYNPFPYMQTARFKSLKYLILSSIGFDQVPMEIINNPNIVIMNNRGGYSPPMGEWIVMMLLMGLKNGKTLIQNHLQKTWRLDTTLLELTEKTIVFLGTGSIAFEGAKRLSGFGCDCVGVNTRGQEVPGFTRSVSWLECGPELAKASAVVCCLPLTKETSGLLDEAFFRRLPEGLIFINVSRGAVIDEGALLGALGEGRFRLCALDVFETEPLPESHPFWDFEEVIVSSHQSWVSEMRNSRRLEGILENLTRIKTNRELLNVVNRERGY